MSPPRTKCTLSSLDRKMHGAIWVRALAMRIRLLPYRSLLKTGPVDHADWNYRPLLGWIMGRRFALFRKLLPAGKAGALLEIGYGSGVFMPELARHCNE